MDLLYVILLILTVAIQDITSEFLQQSEIALELEEVLYSSDEESSLLQCAHRCRFIDKTSAVEFKNFICRCIKYTESFGNKDTTLTGLFTSKEIAKPKQKPTEKPKEKILVNIALFKPATQSSTNKIHEARRGNDALTYTYAITKSIANQWWSVDLEEVVDIDHMILDASVADDWRNKLLYVQTRQSKGDSWTTCKDIGNSQTQTLKVTCDSKTSARYVKVGSKANNMLHINELEVYIYGSMVF